MADKSLKDKAIDIKGKKYVLVSDRVLHFNDEYPNGSITTELVSTPEADMVVIKATVIPDLTVEVPRQFTGYSQATWGDGYINKSAALENAETSAVGRALALMGIGVIDSIASVDEIKKAEGDQRPNRTEEKYRKAVEQLLVKTGAENTSVYNGKPLASMNEKELLAAGKALAAQVEES